MNGKVQGILSKLKRRVTTPTSPTNRQSECEDWPSSSGLLISGDFLPMIHKFDDLFENVSALTHFMTFLDTIDKQHLLKFWLHVEGFKSCSTCEELKIDALHIYDSYIAQNSEFSVEVPTSVQNNIEHLLNSDINIVSRLDCFDEAQHFVGDKLKKQHFKGFLESPYYTLHKIDVCTVGSLQLIDILQDPQLLRLFADFMESQGRLNLLEFILSLENFYQASRTFETFSVVKNAMQVYNRFFQIDAPDALNFDPVIRNDIEENICTKNGTPSVEMFERARRAASAILETRFIPLFVKSTPFIDHIHTLNHYVSSKIERTEFIPKHQTRESLSSLQSHSQSEDVNDKRSSTADEDGISQCSGYSSEAIKKTGSLARIDLLGRYESLFDNSLCSNTDLQSTRNGLKNILNRFKQPVVQEDSNSYEAAMQIVESVKRMVSGSQSNSAFN